VNQSHRLINPPMEPEGSGSRIMAPPTIARGKLLHEVQDVSCGFENLGYITDPALATASFFLA
jgi:hypothetical protein